MDDEGLGEPLRLIPQNFCWFSVIQIAWLAEEGFNGGVFKPIQESSWGLQLFLGLL